MAAMVSHMTRSEDGSSMSDYAVKIQISFRTFGCACCGLDFTKPRKKSEVPLVITGSYLQGMNFVGECFSKYHDTDTKVKDLD